MKMPTRTRTRTTTTTTTTTKQSLEPVELRSRLKRAWSANFKMVWYVFLRPLRAELEAAGGGQNPQRARAEMSVFNLAQKRSFPPLWRGGNNLKVWTRN
jgi:hypothetical protein